MADKLDHVKIRLGLQRFRQVFERADFPVVDLIHDALLKLAEVGVQRIGQQRAQHHDFRALLVEFFADEKVVVEVDPVARELIGGEQVAREGLEEQPAEQHVMRLRVVGVGQHRKGPRAVERHRHLDGLLVAQQRKLHLVPEEFPLRHLAH